MKPTPVQYAKALFELSQESPALAWPDVSERFLTLLKRRRDTKKLPAILRNLERLTDESAGVKRVRVTTSTRLSEPMIRTLIEQAQKLFAAETFLVEAKVDPRVIGGVSFRTEDELFDATLRNQLNELKRQLGK